MIQKLGKAGHTSYLGWVFHETQIIIRRNPDLLEACVTHSQPPQTSAFFGLLGPIPGHSSLHLLPFVSPSPLPDFYGIGTSKWKISFLSFQLCTTRIVVIPAQTSILNTGLYIQSLRDVSAFVSHVSIISSEADFLSPVTAPRYLPGLYPYPLI